MLEVVVLVLDIRFKHVGGLWEAFGEANRKPQCITLESGMAAVGLQTPAQGYIYLTSPGHRDEWFQLFPDGAEWGCTLKGTWEEICLYKVTVSLLVWNVSRQWQDAQDTSIISEAWCNEIIFFIVTDIRVQYLPCHQMYVSVDHPVLKATIGLAEVEKNSWQRNKSRNMKNSCWLLRPFYPI